MYLNATVKEFTLSESGIANIGKESTKIIAVWNHNGIIMGCIIWTWMSWTELYELMFICWNYNSSTVRYSSIRHSDDQEVIQQKWGQLLGLHLVKSGVFWEELRVIIGKGYRGHMNRRESCKWRGKAPQDKNHAA